MSKAAIESQKAAKSKGKAPKGGQGVGPTNGSDEVPGKAPVVPMEKPKAAPKPADVRVLKVVALGEDCADGMALMKVAHPKFKGIREANAWRNTQRDAGNLVGTFVVATIHSVQTFAPVEKVVTEATEATF